MTRLKPFNCSVVEVGLKVRIPRQNSFARCSAAQIPCHALKGIICSFVEGDYVCFSWCRWHSNPLMVQERFTKETSQVSGAKIDIHPTLKLAPGAAEKEKNIAPLTLEPGGKKRKCTNQLSKGRIKCSAPFDEQMVFLLLPSVGRGTI